MALRPGWAGTDARHSGRPFRAAASLLRRGAELATDFKTVSPLLASSEIKSGVAMLHDYDSLWSIKWQPHHSDFSYEEHFTHYYRPLAALNVSTDVIPARGLSGATKLSDYKLVIAPALLFQDDAIVAALQSYVAEGGHLVLTARSGMKDQYNALLSQRQPGGLREIAGVEVEEFYALEESVPVVGDGFEGTSNLWAERLALIGEKNARVLARYGKSNGWLDGQIAVSVNTYGKGLVYYVGAFLDGSAQQLFFERILKKAGVTPMATPDGIELGVRTRSNGEKIYIVINHTADERPIQLPWPAREHLTGATITSEFALAGYAVAVVTPSKR
jgi:beta-galactosidase